MNGAKFDEAYYERFYERARTRVYGAAEIDRLATGIVSMIDWFGGSLDNVLDVGAGTGLWRDWFAKHRPDSAYRSIEVSEYACKRYGHEPRDIRTWRTKERFDLVICQGVLPYLTSLGVKRAIDNIGAMSRGFLYLEAVTKVDLATVCDSSATDSAMHGHLASTYRKALGKHFHAVGCGLWYRLGGDVVFYELECAPGE